MAHAAVDGVAYSGIQFPNAPKQVSYIEDKPKYKPVSLS
jgi:hypothetical protein